MKGKAQNGVAGGGRGTRGRRSLASSHPSSAAVGGLPAVGDTLELEKRGRRDNGLHAESTDGSQHVAAGGARRVREAHGPHCPPTTDTLTHTHTQIHTCIHTHMAGILINTCGHAHLLAAVGTHMHGWTHTPVCVYPPARICTHMHALMQCTHYPRSCSAAPQAAPVGRRRGRRRDLGSAAAGSLGAPLEGACLPRGLSGRVPVCGAVRLKGRSKGKHALP